MSDFSNFFPSLATIGLVIIGIVLVNLVYGLLKGGVKRGHSSLFTIYDEKKDEFKFGSIVGTIIIAGILFALFSVPISSEFNLNLLAILLFGFSFIILGFIMIGVKIR